MADRTVTLVVCGAPLTTRAPDLVRALQDAGWRARVVGTPASRSWLDEDAMTRVTGSAPRFDHHAPSAGPRQPPSAMVVCPATFNTVNKAAIGAADTYALGQVCEAIGMGVPVLAIPMVNDRLWGHPAWKSSLASLASAGVRLLDVHDGRPGATPVVSGKGDEIVRRFAVRWVVEQLPALPPRS